MTLTVTTTPGNNVEYFRWAGDSFSEEYPNVTIEITEYDDDWYNQNAIRLFKSDDRPDLAYFWLTGFYSSLVETGVLLPLDDLYDQEGWHDVLPEAFNSIMSPLLMYNRSIFEEVGIDQEPATMEELLALGPRISEAGYIPWTSGINSASQATQLFDINIRRHTDDETYQQLISKEIMDYTGPQTLLGTGQGADLGLRFAGMSLATIPLLVAYLVFRADHEGHHGRGRQVMVVAWQQSRIPGPGAPSLILSREIPTR